MTNGREGKEGMGERGSGTRGRERQAILFTTIIASFMASFTALAGPVSVVPVPRRRIIDFLTP